MCNNEHNFVTDSFHATQKSVVVLGVGMQYPKALCNQVVVKLERSNCVTLNTIIIRWNL